MTRRTTFNLTGPVALLLVLVALCAIPSITAAQDLVYPVTAGKYSITQDAQRQSSITMLSPGYSSTGSPGDPQLPERLIELRVPDDIVWDSVKLTVEVTDSEVLDGTYLIAPAPPLGAALDLPYDPDYLDWGEGKQIVDGRNLNVYGVDADYPAQPVVMIPYTQRKEPEVQVDHVGNEVYGNVNYLRLLYRPFLYNPVTGKLTLIGEAQISISFAVGPTVRDYGDSGSDTADYVIITTSEIVAHSSQLAYFVQVKEAMGHTVRVVTESDYDGLVGQAPNGRAERIRQWLVNNYDSLGIDYVLLIGDPDPDDPLDPADTTGDVPMKMCWPRYFSWKHRESPTDLFFADLTGNWDVDGDGRYGEAHDPAWSLSPDPAIGPDTFSARWTGWVNCDFDESYTFSTFSDEGVRLYVDGNLVIDNWVDHMPATDAWTNTMTAGKHPVTLEFREMTGDAELQLWWRTNVPETDAHYVRENIVPADHLYDGSDAVGGLSATYYDNADFTGATVSRKDAVVNFVWGSGDLGRAGGPDNGAEVFVGRIPVYGQNYANLDSILEKIVRYETDPGDIGWRRTALLPMKPLWDDTPSWHLGELVKNDLATPAGFTSYRIYDADYSASGGPTPEHWPTTLDAVRNEWLNGYGVVTWATHGSRTGAGDIFNSATTTSLDNLRPAFTFQASCNNGYPEAADNLGYSLLLQGAAATVSASRVSWEANGAWTPDSTDPVNHNLAYYYDAKIMNAGSPQAAGPALYATKAGMIVVEMNLLDYNLYGDPDCYLLKVTLVNFPPTADPGGPYVVDEGTPVIFDGSGSSDPDPGDSISLYEWDFESDGVYDDTGLSPAHTWCDNGVHTVTLRVTDTRGATATASTTVTVNNVAPVANAGLDQAVNEADTVSFTGTATDPGCDTLTFEWDLDNDGAFDDATGTTASWSWCDNGVPTVSLRVTDDDGGSSTDSLTVTVNNVAPVVTMNPFDQPNPQFVLPVVHTLTFHGTFTDPGCDTWTYEWNFGDGTAGVSGDLAAIAPLTAEHAFGAPGDYTVTLTVTDDDGGSDARTIGVHVADAAEAKHDLADYIQALPATAFRGNADQRKNAFANMFRALDAKLESGAWNGFVHDITSNVRDKADGLVEGNPGNDWITSQEAQQHVCMKIDDIVAYVRTLV